jgi:hypothetical protein
MCYVQSCKSYSISNSEKKLEAVLRASQELKFILYLRFSFKRLTFLGV